mmetsp:Transcript_1495/g.3096  ORF Transcript_1495/g.3096 Transcript_1495/m.3096 type:complete len:93 (-) Transcript_1495:6-284(-)
MSTSTAIPSVLGCGDQLVLIPVLVDWEAAAAARWALMCPDFCSYRPHQPSNHPQVRRIVTRHSIIQSNYLKSLILACGFLELGEMATYRAHP